MEAGPIGWVVSTNREGRGTANPTPPSPGGPRYLQMQISWGHKYSPEVGWESTGELKPICEVKQQTSSPK